MKKRRYNFDKFQTDPTAQIIHAEWEAFKPEAHEYLARWPRAQQILTKIRLDVSERQTRAAGYAYYLERVIRLSLPLFRKPQNRQNGEIRETLAHEAAHIIAYNHDGKDAKGHSFEWYFWARTLGCSGSVYHHLDTRPEPNIFIDDLVI